MSETKHTPLPWEADFRTAHIIARNVEKPPMLVCEMRGWGYLTGKGHGALGLHFDEARKIQEANAAFIIEAVNGYAASTAREAALREALIELMDRSRAIVGGTVHSDGVQEALDMFWESRKKARAALSLKSPAA